MTFRIRAPLVVLALSWSSASSAQRPDWVNQILIAAELPVSAAEARREGAPSDEIRRVLEAMRAANVPAHEARGLIEEERVARREHGPVDNFGAFVQSRLQAGLRGRELAAAIRAEHAARGKGRPARPTMGQGKAAAPDTANARGRKAPPAATTPSASEKGRSENGRPTARPDRPGR